MPASRKSQPTVRKSPGRKSAPRAPRNDAIAFLKADHREVKGLFEDYKELVEDEADGEERQAVAERICLLLTVHATVEEEIFYPAAHQALDDTDLVDEATVEHASAKELIAQIQAMAPDEALYDAKVTVLGEYIDHHVKEEEGEMFPKARASEMDLATLGEQMKLRKEELMTELGVTADEAE